MKIKPVKGRPMLHWVGKRPIDKVNAYPEKKSGLSSLPENRSPARKLDELSTDLMLTWLPAPSNKK